MTSLNPITGSILQTGQVQRQQSAQKDREARDQAQYKKKLAEEDEALEEQVESADAISGADDDHRNPQEQSGKKGPHLLADDEPPHLDLRA